VSELMRVAGVARGVRWRWAAGALLLSVVVLVVVLAAGGGGPGRVPAGLPDSGPVTGWGLPLSRLVADLAGVATVGLLLAAGFLVPSPTTVLTRPGFGAAQLAVRSSMVWAVAVAFELWLTVSDLLGMTPGRALDATLVRSFVTQIPQGRALLAQLVLALVVAGVARSALTSSRSFLAAVLAGVTLVPPTLTGHSSASGHHDLAVASLMVHVVSASLWVGGLLALLWLAITSSRSAELRADERGLSLALVRFSALAGVCWVAVGVSGVVNAAVRLQPGDLFTSSYGVLVMLKALALLVLGGFGWWHRRYTVPQMELDVRRTKLLFARVAAVELLVMGATLGLAVGLSRTPTPVTAIPDTSQAEELLGGPMPPAPDFWRVALGETHEGFLLVVLLIASFSYATGVRKLWMRGDFWPLGRVLSWYSGVAVAGWASVGGLGLYAHVMFSAHMVSHMMLSMVAPIGLVLGAPVTLALRALPGPRVPKELGLRQLLQLVLDSWPVRVLTEPLVAAALFVVSLYGLYFTPLFGDLMENHLGHAVMELHFLAVGCLFFWVVVGVDPTPRRWHPFARIALMLVVVSFHAFFAIALMNTDQILAKSYYTVLDRPYSTDLLADQHLGAGITWALGEVPILLVLAAIFVQWIRSDRSEAQRIDRRADRAEARRQEGQAPDDDLSRYNAYLTRLSRAGDPHTPSSDPRSKP
jgi:cytochrome c oxidase assembly factor CtaG/putative copper export protein